MNNENMQIRTGPLMVCLIICLCLILNKSSAQEGAELGGNTLMANSVISAVCSDPAGNIYAAGGFTNSSSNYYVAKWNGSAWSALGGNTLAANGGINSICSDAAGNIYAAGSFTNSTNSSGKCYVAKWNGSSWSELGGTNALAANAEINSIYTDAAGNLYAGGYFKNSNGYYIVAKWNGNSWSQLGSGFGNPYESYDSRINTLCTDPSGHVYVAGAFMDGDMRYYVAEWIDTAWIELGGTGVNDAIASICSDPSGNIYAVGNFNSGYYTYVAKWDGSTWSELGDSTLKPNNYVTTVHSDASGNIYAAGAFGDNISLCYIAKWNGTAWSHLGGIHSLPMNNIIYTLCSDTSGNIYAGGIFTNSSGNEYVAEFARNQVVYNHWFDTICQGSSVIVGGRQYMANGAYTDTLMAVQGGDSVVNLHLMIDTLRHAPTASLTLDSMIAIGDLSAGQGSLDTSYFWWSCLNPAVFRMTGGVPAGGIYSGRWISGDSINIPKDIFTDLAVLTYVQTFVYTYTDSGGCYANVIASFPLTLCGDNNGIPSQASLSLYPNPNNGSFTLVTSGSIGSQYTITDMMGRVVVQDMINSPSQDISLQLEYGVYIITVDQSTNISLLEGLSDYTTVGPQSLRFVVMRR